MAQTHSLDLEASSSQYAYYADNANFDGLSAFTIEVWVKFESITDDMMPVTKWGATLATNQSWRLITASGKLQLFIGTGAATGGVTANQTLSTGVWYHVAFTWNGSLSLGSRAKAYVNGKDVTNSDGTPATMLAGNAQFLVGNRDGVPGAGFYDGLIKDVRLFNDVRTQAEIVADARTEDVTDGNLIGEWNFNNAYTDSSGNGYTLTASGSPTFSTDRPWVASTAISGSTYLETNLVAYYTMDETSGTRLDSTANNNDLTVNGTGGIGSASGKISIAADLEASETDYFSLADASQTGLDFSTAFSAALWVNLESTGVDHAFLQKGVTTGNQFQYEVYIGSDAASVKIDASDTGAAGDIGSATVVASSFSTATWYHVVVTFSSGVFSVYKDGIFQGSTTLSSAVTSLYNGTGAFGIGTQNAVGGKYDGLIDEMAVYDRALHYGDILDLYNAGTGITFSASASGPANLKSYNTNIKANIKSYNGNLIANIKSISGNS